jgi:hypothetical protein
MNGEMRMRWDKLTKKTHSGSGILRLEIIVTMKLEALSANRRQLSFHLGMGNMAGDGFGIKQIDSIRGHEA